MNEIAKAKAAESINEDQEIDEDETVMKDEMMITATVIHKSKLSLSKG